MDDDIRTEGQRTLIVGSGPKTERVQTSNPCERANVNCVREEGVVYSDDNATLVGQFRDKRYIHKSKGRVCGRLDPDKLFIATKTASISSYESTFTC
jgi:uncharacterized protein YjhX (UPF0386 family)